MSSFAYWEAYLSSARNGNDRPVANNTRVHWRGEDRIAIVHHCTDIVTFHRDGRITLANGGWWSVTTKQRINEYSPARIYGSDWELPFEHDPRDPQPAGATERCILKPFDAADPGPEPVDDGVGCRVGETETYEIQEDKVQYSWSLRDENPLASGRGFPVRGSEYNHKQGDLTVRLTGMHTVEYVCDAGYWEHQEVRERGHEAKQCKHCEAFKARHRAWKVAYEGCAYGGRERESVGYRQMVEHLEKFGSREAWQECYIGEFRAVRAAKAEHKLWHERNFTTFYSGVQVTRSGEVPLKFKREHCKKLKREAREDRQRKRRNDESARRLAKLEQQRAYERDVRTQIVLALAGNVNVELDAMRPEWQAIKEKHHGQRS